MECWDAEMTGILSSEYEILFCVRDMLGLYEKQLKGLYGELPSYLNETKDDIEKKIRKIEQRLEDCL